jgi:hypothetical protein
VSRFVGPTVGLRLGTPDARALHCGLKGTPWQRALPPRKALHPRIGTPRERHSPCDAALTNDAARTVCGLRRVSSCTVPAISATAHTSATPRGAVVAVVARQHEALPRGDRVAVWFRGPSRPQGAIGNLSITGPALHGAIHRVPSIGPALPALGRVGVAPLRP